MKVLDLFCGLCGWSQAFKERGHDVVTVDNNPKFNSTICKDIMELTAKDFEKYGHFDVILASPPCNCFSIASVYRHWDNGIPKEDTKKAIELVFHTLKLIDDLKPTFWILENPMCMLRKVIGKPTVTITQCQYGRDVMKPTDLWGDLPKSFEAKRCKNGDICHERSPRGSHKTGIQSLKNPELRAKIPYGLSLAICFACEKEFK